MADRPKVICLINDCDIPEYVFKIHISKQRERIQKLLDLSEATKDLDKKLSYINSSKTLSKALEEEKTRFDLKQLQTRYKKTIQEEDEEDEDEKFNKYMNERLNRLKSNLKLKFKSVKKSKKSKKSVKKSKKSKKTKKSKN